MTKTAKTATTATTAKTLKTINARIGFVEPAIRKAAYTDRVTGKLTNGDVRNVVAYLHDVPICKKYDQVSVKIGCWNDKAKLAEALAKGDNVKVAATDFAINREYEYPDRMTGEIKHGVELRSIGATTITVKRGDNYVALSDPAAKAVLSDDDIFG